MIRVQSKGDLQGRQRQGQDCVYDKGTWQGCLAIVYGNDAWYEYASRMQATKECINKKIHSKGACQGGIAMIHDKSTEQG